MSLDRGPSPYLTDVLRLRSGEAHRGAERWVHVISADVEAALDSHFEHPTTCPHGNHTPGSGYSPRPLTALADVPIGERVHVERSEERLEAIAGLLDQLERDGLVRGTDGDRPRPGRRWCGSGAHRPG